MESKEGARPTSYSAQLIDFTVAIRMASARGDCENRG